MGIKRFMSDMLDLPPELTCDSVRIVITGDTSLTAENHRGISEYDEGRIVFGTAEGSIEVLGEGLSLAVMTDNELAVEGRILAVCIVREE